MNYGFVYVLRNESMPGIYKVGMTQGSPRKRADELSSSTSVPTAFEVVCYVEVDDCQAAERWAHERLKEFRVASNREFFRCPVCLIGNMLERECEWAGHFTEGDLDYASHLEGGMYDDNRYYGVPDETTETSEEAPVVQ
jgi:hypothetical protein